MTVGEKIKELRKKNGFTQENLAQYLCVSSQAVSKWECGISCPDLALIVPITKLFRVTADQLLGIDEKTDAIRAKFDIAYDDSHKKDDIERNYHMAADAVREYPGDFRYLEWLARAEYYLAFDENLKSYSGTEFFDELMENSLMRYEYIIENCTDEFMIKKAVLGKVIDLTFLGRIAEADWSAEFEYPASDINTAEDALKLSSDGETLLEYLEREQNTIT